jgi:hypothetical protein
MEGIKVQVKEGLQLVEILVPVTEEMAKALSSLEATLDEYTDNIPFVVHWDCTKRTKGEYGTLSISWRRTDEHTD